MTAYNPSQKQTIPKQTNPQPTVQVPSTKQIPSNTNQTPNSTSNITTVYCPFCGEELDYMKPLEHCPECGYMTGIQTPEGIEWTNEMTSRMPLPKDYQDGRTPLEILDAYTRGFAEGLRYHYRRFERIGNPSERKF